MTFPGPLTVAGHPSRADRCPGALTLHEAADGLLARVRLPGGYVTAPVSGGWPAWPRNSPTARWSSPPAATCSCAASLRTIRDALADGLADLGLLPSLTHERVRNIVASPGTDLSGLVGAVDAALCARPALGELSGRFLFGLDDGTGDVSALRPDVTAVAAATDVWTVYPGAFVVSAAQVPAVMMDLAAAFLVERAAQSSGAWRIADLVDGAQRVVAQVSPDLSAAKVRVPYPARLNRTDRLETDRLETDRLGTEQLEVVVPLGRLSAGQARGLAELVGAEPARFTPWRTVVLPTAERSAVVTLGLDPAADSPWKAVTACAGRPGCAKALADVQADARAAVLTGQTHARPVHWSGCERRCGHPQGGYTDVLATASGGYQITAVGA